MTSSLERCKILFFKPTSGTDMLVIFKLTVVILFPPDGRGDVWMLKVLKAIVNIQLLL
jgi:hypothetical protein